MGLFGKLLGGKNNNDSEPKNKEPNFSYIAELARLISSDDTQLMKKIDRMITSPAMYFEDNVGHYDERCVDVNGTDADTLMWIGLVDELSEHGYLFGVDWKCEAADLKWALSQLKSGYVIPDLSGSVLDESKDIVEWGAVFNGKLPDHCVCWVDIDSDSYELIIVTTEVYDKISKIAESNGHRIVKF